MILPESTLHSQTNFHMPAIDFLCDIYLYFFHVHASISDFSPFITRIWVIYSLRLDTINPLKGAE